MKVRMIKLAKDTSAFKAGKKLFVQQMSGNQSAKVTGIDKNKRRASMWVSWKDGECKMYEVAIDAGLARSWKLEGVSDE